VLNPYLLQPVIDQNKQSKSGTISLAPSHFFHI
jgi:hypothetical protein